MEAPLSLLTPTDREATPFLISRVDGTKTLILACSWSMSGEDGVIRFYDWNSRVVKAIATSLILAMHKLTTGPVIYQDGEPVYEEHVETAGSA